MATVEMGRGGSKSRTKRAVSKQLRGDRAGMQIATRFCPPDTDPFETVEWEIRSAAIKDESGKALFEQTDCEIPAQWSQLATNVVVSKYFYGEPGTKQREKSVKQLIHRVTRTITDWGIEDGYFDTQADGERFYRELSWLCLHQHGSFNSPVWFNVGLFHQYGVTGAKCTWNYNRETGQVEQPDNPYEYPQGSACFIQSVDDNMEDIMRLASSEAMLFKFGSGTGTDLSTIRSSREKLSGGGTPSGPLSFMKVYDAIAGVIKSGGKTRRAAKMQSLKISHPDIMEFIECKWREEQKAHALIREGYESNFNGEAYSSVCFQNANLSVRVTDDFMEAVANGDKWTTTWVSDKARGEAPTYDAKELLTKMAECAWNCGDPGVQYDTTINKWHTCPNSGPINASNPCVTGDTLVATADGYRRIIDLVGKTIEVIDGRGKKQVVDRVFKTGTKPVFELKTRSGYSVRLTADHRVWTENRGDVPACELTTDDVVKLERPGFGNDYVPAAFGELLGASLGDGCITHGANDQEFLFVTLDKQEGAVAEQLRRGLDECKSWLGGSDGRALRESTITSTATTLRVGTSVSALLEKLQHYATLDQGSAAKRLADAAFGLDAPSQAALLRGLFTADGTVANYGEKSQYVALDSTSLELLQQVQLLLLGFGIKAKIYENRRALDQLMVAMPDGRGGTKDYAVQQMHSLRISRRSRVEFERQIGFMANSVKSEQLAQLNANVKTYADPMTDRVKSLRAAGVEDVYDLTEPVTSHFVANGLVVHNCSEYMFLDNTACNLASINLMKFRQADGTFNVEGFTAACRLFFIAQEILVGHASYPTDRIAENSYLFRPLGLGYANLGSLIMTHGAAYDSDAAHGVCGSLTALLHGAANLTSAEMAGVVGPFEAYEENKEPMQRVMRMHRDAVEDINDSSPEYLKDAARQLWDKVIELGNRYGYRNAQATVLAPTGTISFMMDCDTTGIEPDIALVKYKQLAGGGMLKIVNRSVKLGLENLGYTPDQVASIITYVDENDTIEGAPFLQDEHLSVFDCAFKPAKGTRSIPWQAHVQMMAAAQPFLSGAISKTVNMPNDVAPKDIADAYFWGWELGLKAIAIYRDGSKQSQPLNTKSEGDKAADKAAAVTEKIVYKPRRERLPDTRQSITHKFNIAGHEGYLNVGLYPDGRPGELFITMAKEGSTVGGLMDSFGTAISMSLQYGVPLEVLVNKFSHTRFEPMGHTTNPDIRIAKSMVDYIFRWMGITFLAGYREAATGQLKSEPTAASSSTLAPPRPVGERGPGGEGQGAKASSTATTSAAATSSTGVAGSSPASSTNSKIAPSKSAANQAATSKRPQANGNGALEVADECVTAACYNGGVATIDAKSLERAGAILPEANGKGGGARDSQFAGFQSDAPSCDNCGSITVRNGNCYLCHNCGNSMGCS